MKSIAWAVCETPSFFSSGFAHPAIEGITSPAYTVFGFSEPEKHTQVLEIIDVYL